MYNFICGIFFGWMLHIIITDIKEIINMMKEDKERKEEKEND